MSRLTVLIEKYDITIETTPISKASIFSTPYTLFYAGREVAGKIVTDETISCERALQGAFTVASQTIGLKTLALQRQKELREWLGDLRYEEFWRAWQLDEQEAGRRYQRPEEGKKI